MLFSLLYWLISLLIFFVFEKVFVLTASPFLTGLYIAGIIFANFTIIKNIAYNPKTYNKIIIIVIIVIALITSGYSFLSRDVWLTQPYINKIPNIANKQ